MTNIIGYSITMSDNYSTVINDFRKRLEDVEKKIGETTQKTEKWNDKLKRIGNTLTTRVTLPLAGMATYALKQTANFDEMRHRLEFVSGSAEKATIAFKAIKKIAMETGLSFESLSSAEARMISLGYSVDKASKVVEEFAQISKGTGKPVDEIASAFIRLEMASKKTGGVPAMLLRRLQAAGVGIYGIMKEIGVKQGMSVEEVEKRIAKGEATMKLVEESFAELAKRQPFDSIEESVHRAHNILRSFGDDLVQAIFPADTLRESFKKLDDTLIPILDNISAFTKEHPKIVLIGLAFAAALGPLLKITAFIYNLRVAIKTLALFKIGAVSAFGEATAAAGTFEASISALILPLTTIAAAIGGLIYLEKKWVESKAGKEAIKTHMEAGVGIIPTTTGYGFPVSSKYANLSAAITAKKQAESESGSLYQKMVDIKALQPNISQLSKPIAQTSNINTMSKIDLTINDPKGYVRSVESTGTATSIKKSDLNSGRNNKLSRSIGGY